MGPHFRPGAKPPFRLSDFDFYLPEKLLARYPAQRREASRLMVISRTQGILAHATFAEIGQWLEPGDLMVMNNTRVIPARLNARKERMEGGALIDVLLVAEAPGPVPAWVMLLDPLKKLKLGHHLLFGDGSLVGHYSERLGERECLVTFPEVADAASLRSALFALGSIPLPPYLKRKSEALDRERYQTVYASAPGALAAPTAGLHFTPTLLEQLAAQGVQRAELTLHVGTGTFNPIHEEDLSLVRLHREWYEVPEATARIVNALDASKNLVLSIGTTSLRSLESATDAQGVLQAGQASTELFIQPPYRFRSTNALLTNFHTPLSSLLMLVAAFMGYDLLRESYAEAIGQEYRFYSYGDAMLVLP